MGIIVEVDYSPLFKRMEEKGITAYRATQEWGIPQKTFYNLRKNKIVTIETLGKLAYILDTDIQHLVNFRYQTYKEE